SSRRRHTRSKRDWSSDVCSSDLLGFDIRRGGQFLSPVRKTIIVLPPASLVAHREIQLLVWTKGQPTRDVVTSGRQIRDEIEGIRSEERRVGKECRERWWTDR